MLERVGNFVVWKTHSVRDRRTCALDPVDGQIPALEKQVDDAFVLYMRTCELGNVERVQVAVRERCPFEIDDGQVIAL